MKRRLSGNQNNGPSYSVGVICSVLSAAIMAAALIFPKFYFLAYMGLVPLVCAVTDQRPAYKLQIGLLTGVLYYATALVWVYAFGVKLYSAAVLIEALAIMLFALCLPPKDAKLRYLFAPALWVAVKWLFSLFSFGFTYGSFAQITSGDTYLSQSAAYIGIWGIEYVICFFNVALADFISIRRVYPIVIALLLAAVCYQAGCIHTLKHPKEIIPEAMSYGDNRNSLSDVARYARNKQIPRVRFESRPKEDWAAYVSVVICLTAFCLKIAQKRS